MTRFIPKQAILSILFFFFFCVESLSQTITIDNNGINLIGDTSVLNQTKNFDGEILQRPTDSAFVNRNWQGVVTVQFDNNGILFAAWYTGGEGENPGNYLVLATSTDYGVTWTQNQLIVSPTLSSVRFYDPCLFKDKFGTVYLAWAKSENSTNYYRGLGGVWCMKIEYKNGFVTHEVPMRLTSGIMLNKPFTTNDGSKMLFPISLRHTSNTNNTAQAYLDYANYDDTLTQIQRGGYLPLDNSLRKVDEHMAAQFSDGTYMGVIRGTTQLYYSTSSDGLTWDTCKPFTNIDSTTTSRMFIGKLKSGNAILVINVGGGLNNQSRKDLTAFLSKDNGKTWPYKLVIDNRFTVSYPDLTQDNNGNIYIGYEFDRNTSGKLYLAKLTENNIINNDPNFTRYVIDSLPMIPPDLGGDTTIKLCGDATIDLTTIYNDPAIRYRFKPVNTLAKAGTTYRIIGTNDKNLTDTINVSVVAGLSYNITKTDVSCYGLSNGSVRLNVNDGVPPYRYSFNNKPYDTVSYYSNLSAATYRVKIIDAGGCEAIDSVIIKQPAYALSPNITRTNITCKGANDGTIVLDGRGGTKPYLYSFNNAPYDTVTTFKNLAKGTYIISIKDAAGCVNTKSIAVTEPKQALILNIVSQNVSCNGLANGSVTLNASGGTTPYAYSFNNSEYTANNFYNNLSAGTYNVKVKDASGCEKIGSVTITQPSLLTTDITRINITCRGINNGTIIINGRGGTPPYTFSFNNGPYNTISTFNNLAAGTYNMSVKDNAGCVASKAITITQPAALTLSSTKSNVSCSGGNDGVIILTGKGGTPPYKYNINGSAYDTATNFKNLVAGTYTMGVRDNNGCTTSIIVTLVQSGKPCSSRIPDSMIVTASPNPSNGQFRITITNTLIKEPITVRILDVYGRLIQKINVSVNSTYAFGENYNNGTYFLEVVHGDVVKRIKLLKAK